MCLRMINSKCFRFFPIAVLRDVCNARVINISPIKFLTNENEHMSRRVMKERAHPACVRQKEKRYFLWNWPKFHSNVLSNCYLWLMCFYASTHSKILINFLFFFHFPDTTCSWCRSHASCCQQLFRCTSGENHSQTPGSLQQCSVGHSFSMSPGWLTVPLTNGETSHTMCKFSNWKSINAHRACDMLDVQFH